MMRGWIGLISVLVHILSLQPCIWDPYKFYINYIFDLLLLVPQFYPCQTKDEHISNVMWAAAVARPDSSTFIIN